MCRWRLHHNAMAAMSTYNLVIYVATTQRGGGQQEWDKWNEYYSVPEKVNPSYEPMSRFVARIGFFLGRRG